MITNPFNPNYYSLSNQILVRKAREAQAALIERLEDEEYDQVSSGRIEEVEVARGNRIVKTNYIRYWIERALRQ